MPLAFAIDYFPLLPIGVLIALAWANSAGESSFRFAHALRFFVNDVDGAVCWPRDRGGARGRDAGGSPVSVATHAAAGRRRRRRRAGLGHTPARFRLRSLGPHTTIEGLHLTGADVGLCGVMGALSGAVACASVVLRWNVFGELTRQH